MPPLAWKEKEFIRFGLPDGNRIAFESHNHLTLYVRNIGGPVQDQVLVNDNERKILNDWSPAGNYLVYTTLNPSTKLDLVAASDVGRQETHSAAAHAVQ